MTDDDPDLDLIAVPTSFRELEVTRIVRDEAEHYDRVHATEVRSDLTEFLFARITQDQRVEVPHNSGCHWREVRGCTCGSAARLIAECEAKGQRVALLETMAADDINVVGSYAYHLLCIEAIPYADHPDCREEWKP